MLRASRSVTVALIVLVSAGPVAYGALWTEHFLADFLSSLALQHGRELMQTLSGAIDEAASRAEQLVMDAAGHPGVLALLRAAAAGDKTSAARIAGELVPSLSAPFGPGSALDQVRIIDQSGKEWLRVQQGPSGVAAVPDAQLGDAFAKVLYESTRTLAEPGVRVPDPVMRAKLEAAEKTAEPVIRCVAPVMDPGGSRRLGIVAVTYRREAFFAPIKEFSHTYQGHVVVVDATDQVLFPGHDQDNLGPLLAAIESSPSALIPWKEEFFVPEAHVLKGTWQGTRWRVLLSFPRAEVTAQVDQYHKAALALVVSTFMLALITAVALTAPVPIAGQSTPPPPAP